MSKIYVGNLPFSADEAAVRTLFATHGTVESVALINDRDTGRPRGFGFVEMSNVVRSPRRELRLANEFDFRMYTAAQLKSLLRSVPEWELCDVFDFWYDLSEPLVLNDELSDTMLILRRK